MFGNKQLVIKAARYVMTYPQVGHACWEQYITLTTSLGVLYATSVFSHNLPSLLVGYSFLRKIMILVEDEHSHFRKETCCSLPVGYCCYSA
jgi:hypothetical protein